MIEKDNKKLQHEIQENNIVIKDDGQQPHHKIQELEKEIKGLGRFYFYSTLTEQEQHHTMSMRLYEQIVQKLIFLNIKLAMLLKGNESKELTAGIKELQSTTNSAIIEARKLCYEMSPHILYDIGLEAALGELVRKFHTEYGVRCYLDIDGKETPIDEHLQVILYTCIRELLLNLAQNSTAKDLRIDICQNHDFIDVEVEIDDIDIAALSIISGEDLVCTSGLFCIRSIIQYMGGEFTLQCNEGTMIRFRIPKYVGSLLS